MRRRDRPDRHLDDSGTVIKDGLLLRAASGQSIVVNPGDTLYVRIFPWQTQSGSGKYLLLQSFTVHGTVQ
jgi:hypothetical protein